MGSINGKIAVIGMGCTKFGENWEWSSEDMIVDAAYEAYAEAGIGPEQIEAAWVGTQGSGMAGACLADALKLPDIPITRVENFCATGADAFRNACFAVASGMYDVALALGFEKLKDSGQRGLGIGWQHPVIAESASAPGMFALAGARYLHENKIGREALAKVAVKNHYNGARNPKAHFQREITEETALNAPIIAWPLGLFDCCPTTDGAAAAIITRADLAKNFKGDPIIVRGIGMCVTSGLPMVKPNYSYTSFPATAKAAQDAYRQAGIKDPKKELSSAECHDCFTTTEIINYEDLGVCDRGEGWKYISDGRAYVGGGAVPINTSGGLKSFGHPIGASGIRMMYECRLQLLGKAGERQVKDPKFCAAHSLGGAPTVAQVTIFSQP